MTHVLELMLPGFDGLEVCRRLRQFSDAYVLMLTAREFALLLALAEQPGRVFTRSQLLEHAWGSGYFDEHLIDVHIANLRQKIEPDPAHPVYVETIRGVGYRFGPRQEAAAT